MKTNPLPTELPPQDETEPHEGWDAYQVWNERVCRPRGQAVAAPPQGWDPYFVWLSRVRRSDQ